MQVLLKKFSEALQPETYKQIHKLTPYFDDAEMKLLATVCQRKSVACNDRIFNVDAKADAIYFVLSGSVLCWEPRPDNKILALDITEHGGFCGEVATIGKINRTASATALTQVEVLVLPESELEAFIGQHPALYRKITQGMVERLQRSARDLQHARLRDAEYSDPPPLRLWDRILTWPPVALGSYWFLLILAGVLYYWYTGYRGWDPNVQWLPLWLSIVQIVIGTLVLKSQLHTQKLEEEPRRREREANLIGGKVIEAFEEKQAEHNRRVEQALERILHDRTPPQLAPPPPNAAPPLVSATPAIAQPQQNPSIIAPMPPTTGPDAKHQP